MKKRILALVLMLCMVVSMLPATVLAETELETFVVGETKEDVVIQAGKVGKEYQFTPTESGTYAFTGSPWSVVLQLDLYVSDGTKTIAYASGGQNTLYTTCSFYAEAGKTYILSVSGGAIGSELPLNLTLDYAVTATSIRLPETSKTCSIGDTFWMEMWYEPKNAIQESFTWTSSNPAVATVDAERGYVQVIGSGTANITVTSENGLTASCQIKVATPQKFYFDDEHITGHIGYDIYIPYSFEPDGTSESVTIVSSDPSTANAVKNSWDNWYLESYKLGTVTLTATTASGLTDTCTVTVKEIETLKLDVPKTVTIHQGDTVSFYFTPDESGWYSFYSEDGKGNLNIMQDEKPYYGNGVDTQELVGGETYRVGLWNHQNDNLGEYTFTVCVKKTVPAEKLIIEPEHYEGYTGESFWLNENQHPVWSHYLDNYTYSSSDENVATVDNGTYTKGYVKLVNPGTATITVTATSVFGPETTVVGTCQVTVLQPESIQLNEEKTLTLEYGEKKLYSFTPEEDGYYVFYTPQGEWVPAPDEENVWYGKEFSISVLNEDTDHLYAGEYYGEACYMYAGKTYTLRVNNWSGLQEPITSAVCIEKCEPPTGVTMNKDNIELITGDYVWIAAEYVTSAKFIVGVECSSSNTDVVYAYANGTDIIIDAVGEGTATVTVSLPNGVSASCQVTVKGLEPIKLQEEKTITLDTGCQEGYLYTPEVSGKYVFVTNWANAWTDPETGEYYSGNFNMRIRTSNGEYQDFYYVNNQLWWGVCCYMEAGQSYMLIAENTNESGSLTGTILVDHFKEPQDMFFDYTQTDAWVGETIWLSPDCNEGFMYYALVATWTSSDSSIISVAEDSAQDFIWGRGIFYANKPGVATLTGTLQNGVSISQTITVHEAGVYTVIDGKDAVVPEGEGESLTVRADGHLGWFEGIKVDGKEVAEDNYTATSGSTIIELHADYLATLAPGKHTLDICFVDGNATTSFTIQEAGPEVEFVGASLSLKGDIGLNFFAIIPEEVRLDPNAVMRFTVGNTVKEVPLSQGTLDLSDGSYRYSIPLNAKNMGDNVTAQVFVGDTPVGGTKTLSIKYYADYVINNSSKANFVNLMKAMLNYGSAAQVNFGYDTAHLVNADMSAADRTLPATLDVSKYAHSWSGEQAGIEVTSASLLLQSETKIRIYFKLKPGYKLSDFTFTVDGVAVTPVQSGEEYYIEKANVAAKDLDTMYTFRLGNRQLTYCGLSYVNQVLNYSRDEKLINLAKALYAYNQAANAYFGA